ncbi:hypothetical protein PALB_18150 [Pseudoalteromonas luteoviolacea B = ATCC 29581]|nr:hypothetical protein PALB_18150 [Pseudoalteromonas luteoviolacea B = ATCC 29581]
MRKVSLILVMFCFLSTQVFGRMAFESSHESINDVHGLLHEIGQPHSHDENDHSQFSISFSKDAVEHINQDIDCCVTAIIAVEKTRDHFSKPIGVIASLPDNWSAPFIQDTTPPPRF